MQLSQLSQFFHLEGHGYLEKITYHESKCIAHIKIIHHFHQDAIYLECEVKRPDEESFLFRLLHNDEKEKSIIVSFKAAYRRFEKVWQYLDPDFEDSDEQIVIIRCKLLELGNCYINGSLVDKPYLGILKAA